MTKRMLIDATHPEETRIAVVDDSKLLELDFETAQKKQIKGNIYLAKVMRIEPSLQAAFVEYGGGRQGFLPFTEIHPDYYRIPVSDREALMAAAEEDARAEEAAAAAKQAEEEASTTTTEETSEEDAPPTSEAVGSGHEEEEMRRSRYRFRRQYKIQEVINKNQVMLVQVVKEERGNKGAAITTYLSLAGRYAVLMPNSPRGGGVSRKIGSGRDRGRLKEILDDLNIPDGISVILRTAGADRTKAEIKRDYEYLVRLWDEIRTRTLESVAPALIYEEGNLLKRALRDLYVKDTEEILIEGEEAYLEAKAFMNMLVPSHARRVKQYTDPQAHLFHRFAVEKQIDAMFEPIAQLPSGGYIVINHTEALVSIDVNSGRAIRERHIEETALKTNVEAAEEIARQLRLRDLAGLIVVDFIDMEDRRHNRVVENKLKDALRADRARLQVGRISGFGLLEMSRQRLRPTLHEISTTPCPHCLGTGFMRSVESLALQALRAVEEEALHDTVTRVRLHVPAGVAFYLLNQKRGTLGEIEARLGCTIELVESSSELGFHYKIETDAPRGGKHRHRRPLPLPAVGAYDDASDTHNDSTEDEDSLDTRDEPREGEDDKPRRRRRRRGGRGRSERGERRNEEQLPSETSTDESAPVIVAPETTEEISSAAQDDKAAEEDTTPRRRRRTPTGTGRGRPRRTKEEGTSSDVASQPTPEPIVMNLASASVASSAVTIEPTPPAPSAPKPKPVAANVEIVTAPPPQPKRGWWKRVTGGESEG